ncbi:ATP-binding protein [Paenibacillus sp. MBLB4367]|uniref:ATP-binding protein n=1 Tax=Paenibacillus sp. MBLB4367 TaxID=3384767 RepID=UPI003907EC24
MKNKIFGIILFSVFVAIQGWLIHVIFSYPITGISLEKLNGQWAIHSFESKNIADKEGLRLGDIILEVDGQAPDRHDSVMKWKTLDQFEEIVVSRDGQRLVVKADDGTFTANTDLLPLIGGMLSFAMALMLSIKLKGSASAKYLSYVFLNTGLVFMSLGASARGDALGKIIVSVGVMFIPVVFLHFLMVVLQEKGAFLVSTRFVKAMYVPIIFSLLLHFAFFIVSEGTYPLFNWLVGFTMVYFIAVISIIFVFFVYLFVKYAKEKSYLSTLIKTVWCSLFISFSPIVILTFIPKLIYGRELVDSFALSWTILFFPISFAYLITTKQLYNVDMIVRRIMMTTIIALLPSAVFTGLFAVFYQGDQVGENLVLLFLILVVLQSFLLYSLEYFVTKMQAFLFPRKHLLQMSIKKIAKNLSNITSFHELKSIILVDIVQTLEVYGGAIVFKYKETVETIYEGEIDIPAVEAFIASGSEEHPDFSCLKINSHEEFTSHLIMTRTRANTLLGMEELQWLNIIVSYLAVSLENMHLIRKLTAKLEHLASQLPNKDEANDFQWFRKLTFELQEKERGRIATDLHDTTMQDLFFLKRRLSGVLNKYAFQKEDAEQMNSLIEYIEIINTNLRQSCFELHPHLLKEIGLIRTLEKVIEREAYGSPFVIDFQTEQEIRIENRDMETKRHLFRMIQELLNNAKKHSEASKVVIRLKAGSEGLILSYEDNGVGFDPNRTVPKQIGSSGIGIEQLKSRVLHLNGIWELKTGKGCGVKINIALPSFDGLTA